MRSFEVRTCRYCGCYLPDHATVCLACGLSNSKRETQFQYDEPTHRTESISYMEYDPDTATLKQKRYEYVPGVSEPTEEIRKAIDEINLYQQYYIDNCDHWYEIYHIPPPQKIKWMS